MIIADEGLGKDVHDCMEKFADDAVVVVVVVVGDDGQMLEEEVDKRGEGRSRTFRLKFESSGRNSNSLFMS